MYIEYTRIFQWYPSIYTYLHAMYTSILPTLALNSCLTGGSVVVIPQPPTWRRTLPWFPHGFHCFQATDCPKWGRHALPILVFEVTHGTSDGMAPTIPTWWKRHLWHVASATPTAGRATKSPMHKKHQTCKEHVGIWSWSAISDIRYTWANECLSFRMIPSYQIIIAKYITHHIPS